MKLTAGLGNKYSDFYIFILSNRILHRRGQSSGITDPWVTKAANPHTDPALQILNNSLSTVTERLNNLLNVTKRGSGTAALPPKQAGLSLYYLSFITSYNLMNHCVQKNWEGKNGTKLEEFKSSPGSLNRDFRLQFLGNGLLLETGSKAS